MNELISRKEQNRERRMKEDEKKDMALLYSKRIISAGKFAKLTNPLVQTELNSPLLPPTHTTLTYCYSASMQLFIIAKVSCCLPV
jgi:hypothetical protein